MATRDELTVADKQHWLRTIQVADISRLADGVALNADKGGRV